MNAVDSRPILRPRSVEEVVDSVCACAQVLAFGAGTKPVPSTAPPGCASMSLAGLSGILEYDPCEYTFTALAGTPLATVATELARNGQHMPFDPPLAASGATLGGTIASGLSGPGRQRYGGVRDFILGVRFVTGAGELVRGGGKVVKNAAGFDIPKLLVGSLGRMGVLVEATFKVFPRPRAFATLLAQRPTLDDALATIARLGAAPFDIEALELDPPGALAIRLGGAEETFATRLAALERFVGGAFTRLEGPAEGQFWETRAPNGTGAGAGVLVVKVPLTLAAIPALDTRLAAGGAHRSYGSGGSVGWIRWPGSVESLEGLFREQALCGLVLAGPSPRPLVGVDRAASFRRRIKEALDPNSRFPEY